MNNPIAVFEHQPLKIGEEGFDENHLKAFQEFKGNKKDFPYYSIIPDGIKFSSYVGAIQVGKTVIEVLPKADENKDENHWQKILIGMLRSVNHFEIKAPIQSSLKIKHNSILDLYFEIFVKETEYLLRTGLIKQYRKTEGNLNALKGRILFQKNIQKNLTHKERFFVSYTTYDKEHVLNKILYKTLKLLQKINANASLQSRICALLLDFPEMPDIKATESTFSKIAYSRKTEAYRNAINIAKMLLLNHHPDIQGGSNSVLALMFDMNKLWEKFVYKSLKKNLENFEVREQASKPFWNCGSKQKTIRPDIVIKDDKDNCMVLDTKWKYLGETKEPDDNDLRQVFAYSVYFKAQKTALVYPGDKEDIVKGKFEEKNITCDLIFIPAKEKISEWQEKISAQCKPQFTQ